MGTSHVCITILTGRRVMQEKSMPAQQNKEEKQSDAHSFSVMLCEKRM